MSFGWNEGSALILGLFVGFILEWIWDLYFKGAPSKELFALESLHQKLTNDLKESNQKRLKLEEQLLAQQLYAEKISAFDKIALERDSLKEELSKLEQKSSSDGIQKLENTTASSNGISSASTEEIVDLVKLKHDNELLKDQLAELSKGFREPLEKINGIGLVFQRKLWEGGVNTFQQLAGSTPESIRSIIKPEEWQRIEVDHWIKEANEFATGEKN